MTIPENRIQLNTLVRAKPKIYGSWPNFWARDINSGHVGQMVDRWVMNAKDGFMGLVPLRIRAHHSEQIPPFSVSTINTWLAIEGMFRHRIESAVVAVTLGHIDGMNRERLWVPGGPEAWDQDDKPWGSMDYDWNESILLPLIEQIGWHRFRFGGRLG